MPAVTWSTPRRTTYRLDLTETRRLLRTRDSRGRMLPTPATPALPDEQMPIEEITMEVRSLWQSLPTGGRGALARAMQLSRHQLRLISVGKPRAVAMISGTLQRRMSRTLNQIRRGEIELHSAPPSRGSPMFEYGAPRPTAGGSHRTGSGG